MPGFEELQQLMERHPVRCRRAQKDAFLREAQAAFAALGYPAVVSEDPFLAKNRNLIAGSLEDAALLFTAHYDTPYRMLIGANILFPRSLLLTILAQLPLVFVLLLLQIAATAGALLLGLGLAAPLLGLAALVLGCWLLLFCFPNKHNRNDNTSGVLALLYIANRLPPELRGKAAFVLFDNEEKCMLGSFGFRNKYKQRIAGKPLINFDCVGEGDDLLLMLDSAAWRDERLKAALAAALPAATPAAAPSAEKRLQVCDGRKYQYPSDQMVFKKTAAAAAFKRRKGAAGLYIDKLHTPKDTALDQQNLALYAVWMSEFVKEY